MPVPAIVAGATAVAGRLAAKKAAKEVAKKATKKAAEKIAKNSVKVVKADPLSRASKNIKSNRKVQEAKSGDTAKRGAKDAAESNRRNSPYKENQVVRVKSGNAEPYKITGGAGSTARRTGEVIKRTSKKGKK
jgi:predicted fused transcriptional regulator/phosphomethylpyrimidine kinase